MDTTYQPDVLQEAWQAEQPSRRVTLNPDCPTFSMMLPPPNVTGSLHMGHGFQQTLMDILTRYHAMKGHQTLWQPGTDHAGIATQMVVERQLAQEGQEDRHSLGREAFLERVWAWKEHSGQTITDQMRRLGLAIDWERERFTMDPDLCDAVTQVFVQLHREGLIYRGKRLVNWDMALGTAVSDLEVTNTEETRTLWTVAFRRTDDPSQALHVATTRPETLFGDVAVAVHPDDSRYQAWIGTTVQCPLMARSIPIVGDPEVDPTFGTGAVKLTPGHDFNDHTMAQRHNLPCFSIWSLDGHANERVPEAFQGLDIPSLRTATLKALRDEGLLLGEVDHTSNVPRGDRSGSVLEPMLTDQWFVNANALAEPAMEAVRDGRIQLVPSTWETTYFQWLENIQDWCISRQLWWGHRIPAWYDDAGQVYVGHNEAEVRDHHGLADDVVLRQDEDVLDTWFSSALWPFTTLGWPTPNPTLDLYFPTDVLITGFDILFFWVARMVMMSMKLTGQVPFRTVYVTGLIRDHQGQKMSKSKGNVIDPIDLMDGISLEDLVAKRTRGLMQPQHAARIAKATEATFPNGIPAHGLDAVRFTFAALATPGRDIKFDLQRLKGYRNFCNKLWNATRFALLQCDNARHGNMLPRFNALDDEALKQLTFADRWVLSRLQASITTVERHMAQYRFDWLCQHLYELAWHDVCDWYLELFKLQAKSDDQLTPSHSVLLEVLDTLMHLLHPVMPCLTDHCHQALCERWEGVAQTLTASRLPALDTRWVDTELETAMAWLQSLITALRTFRAEQQLRRSTLLTITLEHANTTQQAWLTEHRTWVDAMAGLAEVHWGEPDPRQTHCAVPLEGVVCHIQLDPSMRSAEQTALAEKRQRQRDADIAACRAKLDNPQFVKNAPDAVVEATRQRLKTLLGDA